MAVAAEGMLWSCGYRNLSRLDPGGSALAASPEGTRISLKQLATRIFVGASSLQTRMVCLCSMSSTSGG